RRRIQLPYEVSFAKESPTIYTLAAKSRTGICIVGRGNLQGGNLIGSQKTDECAAEGVEEIDNGTEPSEGEGGPDQSQNPGESDEDPTTTTTEPETQPGEEEGGQGESEPTTTTTTPA